MNRDNTRPSALTGKKTGDTCVPLRRDDLDCHEIDNEAVLFDPAFDTTARLNATAFFIWRSCDGRSTVESIADKLVEAFDVAPSIAAHDARIAIDDLWACGLLTDVEEVVT